MSKCRVLIVSDHPLFAEGVGHLISGQAGLEVVGVVSPDEALSSLPTLGLDVVIVDADRAAQPIFSRMLRENPGIKFIGLSLDNNDINIYYQRNKKSTGVEALVEAIHEPLEWKLAERPKLRLLAVTQGLYGQRVANYLCRQSPEHWIVQQWTLPPVLPDGEELGLLPSELPASELILSLAQSPEVARLLPEVVKMTGAKGVIAPISNADWLPVEQASQLRERLGQLGVTCVFPKPFCSLTEIEYNARGREVEFDDGPVCEFARYFGQPAFKISIEADTCVLQEVQVLRDSPCGCARYVAEKLMGVPVDEAEQQAGTWHRRFPCLASATLDSDYGDTLLNVSGHILRDALRGPLEPFKAQAPGRPTGHFE